MFSTILLTSFDKLCVYCMELLHTRTYLDYVINLYAPLSLLPSLSCMRPSPFFPHYHHPPQPCRYREHPPHSWVVQRPAACTQEVLPNGERSARPGGKRLDQSSLGWSIHYISPLLPCHFGVFLWSVWQSKTQQPNEWVNEKKQQ